MKYINFSFIFTCIITSLISAGYSEETVDQNCQLFYENGEELHFEWEYGVTLPTIEDATKSGTNILKYKFKNIDRVDSVTSPHAKNYFDVELDNEDYFYISVNNDFAQYEENETLTQFDMEVKFACKNGKTREIKFALKIKDTNNHAPTFLEAPYTFNLPMPIPKDYDFEKIVARDVDLTNERVTFAFKKDDENSKGLSIVFRTSISGSDKKNYPAKLSTLDTLDLENDVTLVIYATDSGEPSLTSNTTVTIVVDKANSAPRFSQALYTADLAKLSYDKVKEVAVNFSQGIITLDRGYEEVRSFEISGVSDENKKHLKLTHTDIFRKNNVELQLKLVDLTEKFLSQGVLSLIVTAVKDKVKTETALQIILPEVKSNIESNITTDSPKSEEKTAEDDSTNGYMIATIILSLTTVGLLGGFIYLFINRKK